MSDDEPSIWQRPGSPIAASPDALKPTLTRFDTERMHPQLRFPCWADEFGATLIDYRLEDNAASAKVSAPRQSC